MGKFLLGAGAFVAVILVLILSPFTLVGAGNRAVLTEFGKVQDTVLSEGFHLINPLYSVHKYDVRTQKVEVTATAASKDLQTVDAVIAVNFRVNADMVRSLFQETQGDYNANLIAPAIQESVKAATAQFTADELVTKRDQVKDTMRTLLTARENMRYFVIEDVSIINFDYSDSFNTAIENKVKAEQDALTAKNLLAQKEYEAQQLVVTAQAEAEAMRIKSEALAANNKLVEYEAVQKWNGVLPSYIMGDSVPFINLK